MLDPAVAEAAFKAEANKPVLVTEGALEPSVVLVTVDRAGTVTSLAEATPAIRKDLAVQAARDKAHDLYDQVEDERAGGATLEEAAAKLKLPYRVIDAISADLKAPDGKLVEDIDNGAAVLKEAFESDVGVENSAVRGSGESWVFFDVLDITPARDRTLDEVRKRRRRRHGPRPRRRTASASSPIRSSPSSRGARRSPPSRRRSTSRCRRWRA